MTEPSAKATSIIVVVLLAIFSTLSFSAVLTKSPTFDEPVHMVGAMVQRQLHDFRINPEDPPLLGWIASLPHRPNALHIDPDDPLYQAAPYDATIQTEFSRRLLSRSGDAKPVDAFLNRSRFVFLLLGVGLGALIARWSWELGGAWAAIAAATLYCFDPSFLGHSPNVKSDVPLTLFYFLSSYCTWRFGQSGSWGWMVAMMLAAAAALNVKFTGLLLGPALSILIILRAFAPLAWTLCGLALHSVFRRLLAVPVLFLLTMVLVSLVTWSLYDFRFSATADHARLDLARIVEESAKRQVIGAIAAGRLPEMNDDAVDVRAREDVRSNRLNLPIKLDLWLLQHRLLPEGWLYGIMITYALSLARVSYLLGQTSSIGWWYYFPIAIAVKTATATLIIFLAVPVWLIVYRRRCLTHQEDLSKWRIRWATLVLAVPPALYFITAMFAHVDVGIRHMLPIFPFLYVAMGAGLVILLRNGPKYIAPAVAILGIALAVETLHAWPNYIAFFNLPSGGSIGGLRVLGDSNLDWGQDLPALAKWCRAHPQEHLYLCYFGGADPGSYGIPYVNMPGGMGFVDKVGLDPKTPGVVAMSATNVQGIYIPAYLKAAYDNTFGDEAPFDVLNGTIYLYRWPPRQ